MASPFSMFRRNQRIMMVVLTGLSMFAFLFFDATVMRGGGLPKSLTVLMFAGLCAMGLWFVGRRHGKSNEWALWGALLGGVAAFIFVRTGPPDTSITTNIGNISEATLREMGQRRYQANQFVFRAGQATRAKRASQGFGPVDDRSMVQFRLGQEEAKRLGISLNDEAVNRFISEITDDKLSRQEFSKILKELNLNEGDLFKILKDELEVRLAFEMQAPPYDMWMDFDLRSGQTFFRPKLPATPDEQWEFFEKLHVKESLSAVAFPVDAFLAKVPDPSENDLKELFELRKESTPGADGQPGFIQPHRVKVAYLAAEYEKFESQATPATDDDVEAYYEKNKDRYQIRDFPDFPADDEDRPVDAANPENVSPELPAPSETPDVEAKPDDKPEEKPDQKDEPGEKKDGEKKEGESSAAAATQRGGPIRLVSATTQSEEEPKEDDAAKSDPPADEPAKPAEDAAQPDGEEKPDDKGKNESLDFPLMPPTPGGGDKPIRYRPLDDELRDRIKDEILRDRAFEKMGLAIDQARSEMEGMAFRYLEADEADKPKVAEELADKLKAYAVDHSLEYVETPLMSQLELQTSATESIGAAVLPTAGSMQFQSVTVGDDLFPRTGQVGPLYYPQRADSRLREKRYAWWKIQDVPQHVPEWTDEGIQNQVRTAWKYEKGRQLALQRAEQLRDAVKDSKESFADALAGQTLTGEPGTTSVVIKETPRFSWLTTSMNTPFDPEMGDFMAPRRSFIEGIDQPGDDFMRVVFDQLSPGEVGVAPNAQRSAFYLVKVNDRDGTEPPADVEGFQTLADLRSQFVAALGADRREFAVRPYNLMMTGAFTRVQQEWSKAFDQRYGVEMDGLPESSSGSRRPRR